VYAQAERQVVTGNFEFSVAGVSKEIPITQLVVSSAGAFSALSFHYYQGFASVARKFLL
jgi:hypothetical protein